jgi:hypothetical protein
VACTLLLQNDYFFPESGFLSIIFDFLFTVEMKALISDTKNSIFFIKALEELGFFMDKKMIFEEKIFPLSVSKLYNPQNFFPFNLKNLYYSGYQFLDIT